MLSVIPSGAVQLVSSSDRLELHNSPYGRAVHVENISHADHKPVVS